VLYEQLHMVDKAIADWTLFLQKETDHDWAEDARKRLMALQELKRSKSSAPSTVDQWTAALASNRVTAAEEAIEAAAAEWLPKAFPGNAPSGQELEYGKLLKKAAQKLQSQHGDEWLEDMLAFSSSPYFAQAISELSRAVSLNLQGQASDAVIPASRAAGVEPCHHGQARLWQRTRAPGQSSCDHAKSGCCSHAQPVMQWQSMPVSVVRSCSSGRANPTLVPFGAPSRDGSARADSRDRPARDRRGDAPAAEPSDPARSSSSPAGPAGSAGTR